ncbi:MAG: hypothetical protein Q7U91_13140 [Sideroxyarcus sp.]|nr:hypothetical protein [Sideroxyarcus sp.]
MAVHAGAISGLAQEDYTLIEAEHTRLRGTIDNLRDTCRNLETTRGCSECSREKLGTCRGRLVSFFYNIMDFSANHFKHEESIMGRWSQMNDECADLHRHQQAHRDILLELAALVGEGVMLDLQGSTAHAYRRLYLGVGDLFEQHERLFDDPFIRSTSGGASR